MNHPRDKAYARAVAAAMEADEVDSLAARLEARADSALTDDMTQQRTDLRVAAILLRKFLRDERDRANEGDNH
jgi:hypothetical protein